MRPGMLGASMDGTLSWGPSLSSSVRCRIRSAVSSNVRPGLAAMSRLIRPLPTSNGPAGVCSSSLTTVNLALVISAE
jgi:hypothetical protein